MQEIEGSKWNFNIQRKSSMGQGKEDSSFAPFINTRIRCLVREYIQNSFDAHSEDDGKPVRIEFEFGKLSCSDYPELIQSLLGHLKSCSERCKKYPNSKDPYESKVQYLESHIDGEIGYLKVADYHTTGMEFIDDEDTPSPFGSCVRENGASYKSSNFSGGSHGQGKTVGHVCSGLNAVYYSTMDSEGRTYGEGVIKLCTHKYGSNGEDANTYEGTAFYDSNYGNAPDQGNRIPQAFRRDVQGTSVFVIGMERNAEDVDLMKKELLRSFFMAIASGHLEVEIDGEEFTEDNIKEKLDIYYPEEEYSEFDSIRNRNPEFVFNPRPYCNEVFLKQNQDENHICIDTADFPGEFTKLGHAKLYVWKSQSIKEANSRDSVVYMRNNEMVIEVKRGTANKGYYGIFICDGEGENVGSTVFRSMENVTHDKWDINELRDVSKKERTTANSVKGEIKAFIKACEAKLFPDTNDEEHQLKSLKRRKIGIFGDNRSDSEDDEANWPSTNVSDKAKSINKKSQTDTSIKVRTKKKKRKMDKRGKETDGQTSEPNTEQDGNEATGGTETGGAGGFGEGGSGDGKGTNGQIGTEKPDNTNSTTNLDNPDGNAIGTEDNGDIDSNSNEGKELREIKLSNANKMLKPCRDGQYALVLGLKSNRDYADCSVMLMVQGESGLVALEIKNVANGMKISGIKNNIISGFELVKNELFCIKFTPKEVVTNYSLKITVYGH